MREQIRKRIIEYAEEEYQKFSSALIPGSKPLLGVRLPILRKLARELTKKGEDWRAEIVSYTGEFEDLYFEEAMLRGMIIGYGTAKGDLAEGLQYVEEWIPHVDNWSVCDSFCSSFLLADTYREEVWEFLQKYIYAERQFEVRTALITFLCHNLKYEVNGKKGPKKRTISKEQLDKDTYLKNRVDYPYMERILMVLNRSYEQGYYAQMAAAWTAAEAFVLFPFETWRMLKADCQMDDWTYNKTLQKICESRIPDEEVKKIVKSKKRNGREYQRV